MKILYDHQIFEQQRFGGISRYHSNLYSGLNALGVKAKISVKYSNNQYLRNNGFSTKLKNVFDPYNSFIHTNEFAGKRRLFELKNKFWKKRSSKDLQTL